MAKVTISFMIEESMKQALQKLADKENRSLSNYVATILMKHLQEKGVGWNNKQA